MKFTDRFIKIPVKLVARKDEEMGIKPEYTDSVELIDPLQIERYFPTTDDNFSGECIQISFKSGSGVVCYCSICEFETLLNNWQPESIYQKQ